MRMKSLLLIFLIIAMSFQFAGATLADDGGPVATSSAKGMPVIGRGRSSITKPVSEFAEFKGGFEGRASGKGLAVVHKVGTTLQGKLADVMVGGGGNLSGDGSMPMDAEAMAMEVEGHTISAMLMGVEMPIHGSGPAPGDAGVAGILFGGLPTVGKLVSSNVLFGGHIVLKGIVFTIYYLWTFVVN